MILYFTGAGKFQAQQPQGFRSLGGYISSSLVPNGNLNEIFGSISEYGKWSKKPIYRIIAIYNDSGATLTNIKIWSEYNSADESDVLDVQVGVLKLAVIPVIADECGDLVIEKLPTETSKPYSVELVLADGEGNALSIPDLESGMYAAFVVSRELTSAATADLTEEQYLAILENELSLANIEGFDLKIFYN